MIKVEIWLYGPLARYGGEQAQGTYAHLHLELADGTQVRDVLEQLEIPLEEKGFTFINAVLADMPGLGADLERVLEDGGRVGIFSRHHIWPFQYRFGARMTPELEQALREQEGGAMHHTYQTSQV